MRRAARMHPERAGICQMRALSHLRSARGGRSTSPLPGTKHMRPTVTVVIPVYKVEGVLREVLERVYSQTYPIEKIILIDNHSPDRSVPVAKAFAARHKRIPLEVIEREKTYGVSDSYNLGAKLAKSEYVVILHSDGILPTNHELAKLMYPFVNADCGYVAAMPLVVHRKKEWRQYNFWQKCLFASVVGSARHSLNGKFDAYKRSVFLSLGGYDTAHFNHFIGSEDADMHFRLASQGPIAKTAARVVHAHERESSYGPGDLVARRKFLAASYARQLQLHGREMGLGIGVFFVKPAIAVITVLGVVHPIFFLPIAVFSFCYMRNMFLDSHARKNPNIFLLPIIVMYLVFAETVWLLQTLFRRTS